MQRQAIAKQFNGPCKPSSDEDSDLDPPCILRELVGKAGTYELVDGELVRTR
ncbi:MAG: hypothetical protein M3680_33620 [Myxococcota bacterium]|nr:hypothetical protein [Myxococcota bacterium]